MDSLSHKGDKRTSKRRIKIKKQSKWVTNVVISRRPLSAEFRSEKRWRLTRNHSWWIHWVDNPYICPNLFHLIRFHSFLSFVLVENKFLFAFSPLAETLSFLFSVFSSFLTETTTSSSTLYTFFPLHHLSIKATRIYLKFTHFSLSLSLSSRLCVEFSFFFTLPSHSLRSASLFFLISPSIFFLGFFSSIFINLNCVICGIIMYLHDQNKFEKSRLNLDRLHKSPLLRSFVFCAWRSDLF